LVLSKAGVIHEVLLGLGPCGLEIDTTHSIQDALQGLDVAASELLGLFLGGDRISVRQCLSEKNLQKGGSQKTLGGGSDSRLSSPKNGEASIGHRPT
jgi:hypothetical protein